MRTAAQETALQIVLRNCFKDMQGRGGQYICDFGKGGVHAIKHIYFLESFRWSHEASASHEKQSSPWRISVFLDMKRYKNWAHKINSWEYLFEDLSCQFPGSTECLISALHPELLQDVLEVTSSSSTWFNPCRGRWQAPMANANSWSTWGNWATGRQNKVRSKVRVGRLDPGVISRPCGSRPPHLITLPCSLS